MEILLAAAAIAAIIGVIYTIWSRRTPQPVRMVKEPDATGSPQQTPVPVSPSAREMYETVLLPTMNRVDRYTQWAGQMQSASRDGQLVGLVADFGHAAARFDSKEKFLLPQVLSEYLDVRGFKRPLATQDYAEFEFLPTQDERRVWLRAEPEGVLAIEVWRSWHQVPWDWLLAEVYSSLLCLRDDRMVGLFGAKGVVRATVTLGNLLSTGGTVADVNVTVRGVRSNLVPPGEEVQGDRPRFPNVRQEYRLAIRDDPWECAKTFVKRALADTGVLLFEEPLEAVDRDNFLGLYFDPPSEFRRPTASTV